MMYSPMVPLLQNQSLICLCQSNADCLVNHSTALWEDHIHSVILKLLQHDVGQETATNFHRNPTGHLLFFWLFFSSERKKYEMTDF